MTSLGIIHFKKNSENMWDTVNFTGMSMRLKELKHAILDKKYAAEVAKGSLDFDLRIKNADTNESYTDDNAQIPKNSRVSVRMVQTKDSKQSFTELRKRKLHEEAKKRAAAEMASGGHLLHGENGMPRDAISAANVSARVYSNLNPTLEGPKGYQGKRKNPSTSNEAEDAGRRGVPKILQQQGADGFIRMINDGAILGSFKDDDKYPSGRGVDGQVDGQVDPEAWRELAQYGQEVAKEWACPICKKLLRDAVSLTWIVPGQDGCSSMTCDVCIRSAMREADGTCPLTKKVVKAFQDKIIPNKPVRKKIKNFVDNFAAKENLRRNQEAEAEAATAAALTEASSDETGAGAAVMAANGDSLGNNKGTDAILSFGGEDEINGVAGAAGWYADFEDDDEAEEDEELEEPKGKDALEVPSAEQPRETSSHNAVPLVPNDTKDANESSSSSSSATSLPPPGPPPSGPPPPGLGEVVNPPLQQSTPHSARQEPQSSLAQQQASSPHASSIELRSFDPNFGKGSGSLVLQQQKQKPLPGPPLLQATRPPQPQPMPPPAQRGGYGSTPLMGGYDVGAPFCPPVSRNSAPNGGPNGPFQQQYGGAPGMMGNMNNGRNREVCNDFLRGRCLRGDRCIFSHVGGMTMSAPSMPPGRREVCNDFRKGRCRRGASCIYAHEGNPMVSGDGMGRGRGPREVCNDFLRGRCKRGANCIFLHDNSSTVAPGGMNPRAEACNDFMRGRCTRGEACIYSHVIMGGGGSSIIGTGIPGTVGGYYPPQMNQYGAYQDPSFPNKRPRH